MRKIVLYIVYGDKQEYYDGAKFSILTFKYWALRKNNIEIPVKEKIRIISRKIINQPSFNSF